MPKWTNPAWNTFALGLIEKMQDLIGMLDHTKLSQVINDKLEAWMKPELLNHHEVIVVPYLHCHLMI